IARMATAYRERGYLDARVEGEVAFVEALDRVLLRVAVEEGALYLVREVTFEGNALFRDSELLATVPLKPGEPYRAGSLADAVEAISQLYADQGRWDVTEQQGNLRAEEVYAAQEPAVSARFTIIETEPIYVRRIHIRGLTKTKEIVVRRNLTIYPGQLARADDFRQSEQVLRNTGYFDPEAWEPVRIDLAPQPGPMRDAIVQVQEGPTGRLLIGAGVGSDSGLLGGITIEEDNFNFWNWPSSWDDLWRGNAFRGGGHRLSIVLRAGTERSFYSITFENPAVWNTEYSVGGSLYARGIARNEFDETRSGLSLTAGQSLSKFAERHLTVGYESIDIDDISAGSPAVILREKGTHSKAFVRLGASADRRDDRFLPTDGYFASADLELAAGDVETVKLELRGERYWTVKEQRGRHKHVVGVRGILGLIDSYSGDVPVFERFYAGGFSTLRGFEFEGVSPTVAGKQVGGESMLIGSGEYSFPISEDDRVRLVGFCDAGWVSEDPGDVLTGLDDLRLSLGLGVRWQAPFLGRTAVEFDLATPLIKESGDDTQAFHFSIAAQRHF
ncbi:MAG: BamA/OMP85 family outer membrane protein, partial [Planctomycetota bacterium]